jgi:cysteine desulfurase/selenocysteine lyase
VAGIAELAHKAGAIVVVDAAQSIPHIQHFIHNIGVDFLAFSGHKMHGPTGIGVLYAQQDYLAATEPSVFGGGMVASIVDDAYKPVSGCRKLEAGTPPIIQAIGLGETVRYWRDVGMDHVHQHVKKLTRHAYEHLGMQDGVTVLGPHWEHRIGILSFTVDGVHPHDLAAFMNEAGIAIRAGTHCAIPLHRSLGIPASARMSFSMFNTEDEIDRFMDGLHKAMDIFNVTTGTKSPV